MFSCQHAAERASALLDGSLSRREALLLRAHLAMCRKCRRYLAQLRLTVATVKRLTAGTAPDAAAAEALARRLQQRLGR